MQNAICAIFAKRFLNTVTLSRIYTLQCFVQKQKSVILYNKYHCSNNINRFNSEK